MEQISTNIDMLTTFVNRMKKLGIKIMMLGNYPWIYLHSVNGNIVKETFQARHGFTIAFMPIKTGQKTKFTDISKLFQIIRKYK